jgi:heptaprenyl diphosphate synthase
VGARSRELVVDLPAVSAVAENADPSPVTAALDLGLADGDLDASVRDGLAAVEERLGDAVRQSDRLADDASRHLVRAGGKRMRPMLTLLAGHLGDPARPEIVEAAVVVELTHLATLYHDDVMDSAPVRRGAPAVHQVWGNTVAILTGDLLFARASTIVAGLGVEAVRIQAATFERLCLGQLHETIGPAPEEDAVEHYLQVLADKTGSLIATAGRFGAMFSGADPAVVDVLVRYGEQVGVAFQLADDVIDLASDGAESGKTPGTDLREGVPTLPVLMARASGDPADGRLLELLDADLTDDHLHAEALDLLRKHPAMDEARAYVVGRAAEAKALLAALPEGSVRSALEAFADAVAVRSA